MTEQTATEAFRNWAVVEIFGHERIAGEVSEQSIAGTNMLRVDVPAVGAQPAFTRFYGHGAIYSIQPVSEDIARRAAGAMQVRPVNVYLLPAGSDPDEHDPRDDGSLGDQGNITEGELVLYLPLHVNGDIHHKDVEQGRVSSVGQVAVFVRFGDRHTAQACNPSDLVKAGHRKSESND